MGNTQTCGFGVLNESHMKELNIGLSMAGTHYYENAVSDGRVFYRWPGAVHYTVYAMARDPEGKNDITDGQCAKQITGSSLIGIATAGVTVMTMGSMLTPMAFVFAPLTHVGGAAGLVAQAGVLGAVDGLGAYATSAVATKALGLAFENSKLYCEKKGCYGGGSGSWMAVTGGPYLDKEGYWRPQDLTMREVDQEYVFRNGKFTWESHGNFHTKEGLQCTNNCPYC